MSARSTIAGVYTGNLRNSGEHIRLEAADTTPIADFSYGDDNPWPGSADGDGYSLILSGTDPNNPLHWRTSTAPGGNPGGSDSTTFAGTPSELIPYAISGELSVDVVGDAFTLTFRQNLAADDAEVSVEFSGDLLNWTTATAPDLVSRINQGDGTELVTFQSAVPAGSADQQFARVRVQLR